MTDFKNNNKILFIPGWLDSGARLGYKNSLDVWHKDIDFTKDWGADYVVAHSVGALVALYNWRIYKNFKIILVNPVILKDNLFKKWYQFGRDEGIPSSLKKLIKIRFIIPALFKSMRLFEVPVFNIINTISKDDLVVIYGENDKYFFDSEIIKKIKAQGFLVKEVKGAGHNYTEALEKAVGEIISY